MKGGTLLCVQIIGKRLGDARSTSAQSTSYYEWKTPVESGAESLSGIIHVFYITTTPMNPGSNLDGTAQEWSHVTIRVGFIGFRMGCTKPGSNKTGGCTPANLNWGCVPTWVADHEILCFIVGNAHCRIVEGQKEN